MPNILLPLHDKSHAVTISEEEIAAFESFDFVSDFERLELKIMDRRIQEFEAEMAELDAVFGGARECECGRAAANGLLQIMYSIRAEQRRLRAR